jgi:hypothetical protein
VAGAIRSGLVRRVASQEDGRRSRLELTELGRTLADSGRRIRLELVADAMAEWDETERAVFARLFERFADGLCTAFDLAGAGSAQDAGTDASSGSGRASSGRGTGSASSADAGDPGHLAASEQAVVPDVAEPAGPKTAGRDEQETAGRADPET